MRQQAAHARWVRPLPVDELLFSRQHSPQAWAAALLTRARHATLPDNASAAIGLVEHDLPDTDGAGGTDDAPHAADLASHGHPMRSTARCGSAARRSTSSSTAAPTARH